MSDTVTLAAIKAEQTKLAEMIAAFEAQATTQIHFPEQLIDLAQGEHYAGIITGKDGEAPYHLILLPDEPTDELTFEAAGDWAKRIGGSLPNRREQALLYANLKDQFNPAWYWSGEAHSDTRYAWCQGFDVGYQGSNYTGIELRARAVRRLTIE